MTEADPYSAKLCLRHLMTADSVQNKSFLIKTYSYKITVIKTVTENGPVDVIKVDNF
jgi:hypothetical protein